MPKVEVESPRLFAARETSAPFSLGSCYTFQSTGTRRRKQKAHVPTKEGIIADVSVVYKCALTVKNELPLSGELSRFTETEG